MTKKERTSKIYAAPSAEVLVCPVEEGFTTSNDANLWDLILNEDVEWSEASNEFE
jgi:hypothetical protein